MPAKRILRASNAQPKEFTFHARPPHWTKTARLIVSLRLSTNHLQLAFLTHASAGWAQCEARRCGTGGLTLASVSLLMSCGVNRLQSYVVDMIAIVDLVRCCNSQTLLEKEVHMTAANNTSVRALSASNNCAGRMVAKGGI